MWKWDKTSQQKYKFAVKKQASPEKTEKHNILYF